MAQQGPVTKSTHRASTPAGRGAALYGGWWRRSSLDDFSATSSRDQGLATVDTEDVEGDREGPRVEEFKGAGYEVAVEGEIHRSSFGDAEGHKDWVQH